MPVLSKKPAKDAFQKAIQNLGPRQRELILWTYKLHVTTRAQLQEIVQHKGHSRISVWLKDLVEKEFLHSDLLFEAPGKKKPCVYSLGEMGIRMIIKYFGKDTPYLKQKLKNPWFDRRFLTHDLLVVDFFLTFLRFAREQGDTLEHLGSDEGISQDTEVSYIDDFDIQSNILSEPDAVLRYLKKGKDTPGVFYAEVDRYNMSGPKFLFKIDRYLRFYESRQWKERYEVFPMVLIITVNKSFLETIFSGIEDRLSKYKEIEDLFRLTTFEEIKTKGINASIWRTPLASRRQKTTRLIA